MDKKELIIFAILTILVLIFIFEPLWEKATEKPAIEQPYTPPIITPEPTPPQVIPKEKPNHVVKKVEIKPKEIPAPPPEPQTPSKIELTPAYLEFYVDRIIIPEYTPYVFFPLKEDRIKTYSGKFGPYYKDYRDYIYAELCSHVLGQTQMFSCERVELNYIDNYFTFVRGYPPDEYIGNVAMRNYGAYYLVKSKEHGVLAKSNVAPIKLVHS